MRGLSLSTTLIVAATLLAILADVLFCGASWGVNAGFWAVALVLTGTRLTKSTPLTSSQKGLIATATSFALLFALRDSDALKIANGLAIAFCLGALLLVETDLGEAPLSRLLGSPFSGISSMLENAYRLAERTRNEQTMSLEGRTRRKAIVRGLLLATPLLLVFGGLFASADAVFRDNLESLGRFNLDFESLNARFLTFFFALIFAGGLYERLILREPLIGPFPERSRNGNLGIIEVSIVLGSLVLLFGAFLLVQFRHLFGANETVRVAPDLSYAEYARGGFFELVCVAALALVVLLGADALLKRERTADDPLFRWLGRSLVGMVFCVVASALLRMKLYTDVFGLTELRVYATVFMGWLVLAFLWLLITTLNGRPQRFAFGILKAGLLVIAGTNLLNPDALIVRTNLSKPNADFGYLKTLGDDATVALAESLDAVPASAHHEALNHIFRRKAALKVWDWRELNLSRVRLLGFKP